MNDYKLSLFALLFSFITACQGNQNDGRNNAQHINEDSAVVAVSKEFLFDQPQPFAQCHASTLLHLDDGSFISAWFGGTKEGNDDVGIWMTKGRPGIWETPFQVAKIRDDAHWNPVLFQSPEGRIFLFFKVGKKIPQWETWLTTSDDNGKTWSDAHELVPGDHGGRGPVRSKPIILSDGTWLAGASNEQGEWNAFFDISADSGKTWKATPYLKIDRTKFEGKGIIQPTVWESSPGKTHALIRSSEGFIYRADSDDAGKTWSEAKKTNLPNPNSGIDVAQLSDGTLLLAYNSDTTNWGSRANLAIAVSYDNGETWPEQVMVENEQALHPDDEYSYPALISFGDTVALTYTFNRKQIAFWSTDKNWIMNNLEKR